MVARGREWDRAGSGFGRITQHAGQLAGVLVVLKA